MGIFDLFKGNKIPYEIFHDNGEIKQRGFRDWLGRTTGLIKFYDQQGLIKQESHYLKNNKQGEEKLFYLNGEISSTQIYVDDKLEGKRKMYFKNGKVKSEHTYKSNMVHGPCFNINKEGKVSTGRFTNDVKVNPITNKPIYNPDGIRSEGEVNKENHQIGLHRTFKTENKGLTEYIVSEKEFGPRPNAPEFFTTILWLKTYHKNGKISMYDNKVLKKDSEEYVKAKKESGLNEIDFIRGEFDTKGNLTFNKTGISEDSNGWHETFYNLDKVIQQGHIENGIKSGKWKIFNSETKKIIETFYFPVVVDIIDNPNYSDLDNLKKGDKIAFEMSDKSKEIIPLKGTSFVVWSNPSFPPEDLNRGYPVGPSKLIVDFSSATSPDKSFSKKIEKLKKGEDEYRLEFSWDSKLESINKVAKISDEDTIDKLYRSMLRKIKSFEEDENLEYWFKINLDMVKFSKDQTKASGQSRYHSNTHEMLESLWGHCDEYLIKMKGENVQNKTEFIKMRIISFGAILDFYKELYAKLISFEENEKIDLSVKFKELDLEILHCKARLYGSIKFALISKIDKLKIKEWYKNFIDEPNLYSGIDPMKLISLSKD